TATGTPSPTITYSQNPGTTFSVGTRTITATASNSCGVASCTFTLTVVDTQPPTLTCSTNIVASADLGQCSKSNVSYTVTSLDNCLSRTLTCTPTNGATFPTGTNTVNCVVTDTAGNSTNCSFTVTIRDSEV